MADTIEIIQGTATTIEVAGPTGPQGPAGAAGATGAQGPQGPAGTGIETLTTKGDLLSRNDSAAIRVGIGSTGQILKVSAQGLPTWANESGAVTSVNGATGAVTVTVPSASSTTPAALGTAAVGSASTFARADHVHAMPTAGDIGGVPTSRTVSAGTGLTGGGDLTANRTLAVSYGTTAGTATQGNDSRIVNIIKSGTAAGAFSGGAGGTIDLSGGNADSTYGAGGAAGSINLSGGDALDDGGDGHAGLAGGSIDLSGGIGGAGGSITLRGSQDPDGGNAIGAAGSIDLSGGAADGGAGGSIISTGASAAGGTLNMSAVETESGGSITTSGGGGSINTSSGGGSINTSAGGGDVDTRGTGSIGLGVSGTRTTVTGTATEDRAISFPNASGTVALTTSRVSSANALYDDFADIDAVSVGEGNLVIRTLAVGDYLATINTGSITANRSYTLPNASGTLALTSDIPANTIASTLVDAKGDLIVGTAADTVARLPVGATNGMVLTVDSAEAGGMKWAAAAGGVADGNKGDITVSVSGATWAINANAVTNADLAQVATATIKGRTTAATGNVEDLTAAQARGVLGLATTDNVTFGTLQNTAIGATTAAAGTFTNVTSNNRNFLIPSNGAMRVGMNGTIGGSAIAIISVNEGAQYSATGTNSIAIGMNQCRASGGNSIAIGSYAGYSGTGDDSITMGNQARAQAQDSLALLKLSNAANTDSIAIGVNSSASSTGAIAIGNAVACDLRAGFFTRSFRSVYWGGTTTDATANVELNLDATATNRMTIAANTAVIADIYVIARRTDNSKFLAARRWVAIRRDGSNNTALIGAVQTIGTDQSEGSPTWTFTIDADDTASVESLRVRVTGAAAETINWRVCAIYRAVA